MKQLTPGRKATTILLSALTQFAIVCGGAVMALMANGDAVSTAGWTVAVITGGVAVAKDLRTQLGLSPVEMPLAVSAKKADKTDVE